MKGLALGRRVFLGAFVLCFGAMALWSFATPLFGAPDEPVHIVKAAAVVRGEWLGNLADGPSSPFALVRVPEYYALLRWPGSDPLHSRICFHTHPTIPASCVIASDNGVSAQAVVAGATRQAWIYNARYPPLYYAIVGLPTLFGSGNDILYWMRLVSAFVCSLFIALAASVIARYSAHKLLYGALFVATTPMVLFLGGVVNPSGLEVAAAIATWTSAVVLVREHLVNPPRPLLVATGISAAVLVLTRSLSPLWLAAIGLFLLAIADYSELRAALRRRDVLVTISLIGLVSSLALIWIFKEHATLVYTGVSQVASQIPAGTSSLTILRVSFQHNAFYFPDMVGVFGWFDTWAPSFTYIAWYCLAAALVLGAFVSSSRRGRLALVVLVLAVVVVPVLISSSQARQYGYIWAGRDTLPLAVGLPLASAVLLRRVQASGAFNKLLFFGASIAVIAEFLAFYQALRRYAVGSRGPLLSFITHPSWRPPIDIAVLLLAELVVLAIAAFGLLKLSAPQLFSPLSRKAGEAPDPSPVVRDPQVI